MIRILHTSDWHLGHTLFGKDRQEEHRRLLDFLLKAITEHEVDALIVSGDIFDTAAPPNYALAMYFDFLHRLAATPCRKAIVIGGNHDSASTLHAPRELLRLVNVHVVGQPDGEDPAHDLIVLEDRHGQPAGVVAAVPFLREREVRRSLAGEGYAERSEAYLKGVAAHYALMRRRGRERIAVLCGDERGLPLVATGHLFAAGGRLGESEREVTVGNLNGLPAACLVEGFDYLALGHLHTAQTVRGPGLIRYSGAPLPLGFSEAKGGQSALLVDFKPGTPPEITPLPLPRFQELHTVTGGWTEVEAFFAALNPAGPSLWLEVQMTLDAWGPGVQERVHALAQGTRAEVLAVRNHSRVLARLGKADAPLEELAALTPEEVFKRRLAATEHLSDTEQAALFPLYREVTEMAWQALSGGDRDAD